MATYINPFYQSGNHESRKVLSTEVKPVTYRGFDIYQRIPKSFDAVRDGVCLTMRAGLTGAKLAIDMFHDQPDSFEAQRMVEASAVSHA